jgi:acetyltransferase-like isoleucine patch superfamily enzyme
MLRKIYRTFFSFTFHFCSFIRKVHLQMKYEGIEIDSKTIISKNCQITCSNGSKLILKNCYLSTGVILKADNNSTLSIYDSFIGNYCTIVSVNSIKIDSDCLIAEMVVIRDHNHGFKNKELIKKQSLTSKPILIHSNVWIGAKATILNGAEIKSGAVIGTNSMVNSLVEERSLFAGNPAKLIYSF